MKDAKLSPLKAIRAKCIECSGYKKAEVRKCVIPSCALYPYRMGHDPHRKGIGREGGFSAKKLISANDSEHDSRSEGRHTSGQLDTKNASSVGIETAEKENRPGEESTETEAGRRSELQHNAYFSQYPVVNYTTLNDENQASSSYDAQIVDVEPFGAAINLSSISTETSTETVVVEIGHAKKKSC